MSPRERLLYQLDAAATELEPAMAAELRREIDAHLDAAIAARMELGSTPEEAERTSVEVFGNVTEMVRAMEIVERPTWFSRRFLARIGGGWLVLFAAGYAGWHFAPGVQAYVSLVLAVLGLGLAGLTLAESVRARLPQVLPLLAMYVVFVAVGAGGQAAMALPDSDRGLAIDRQTATEFVAHYETQASVIETAIGRYDAERRAFTAGSNIVPTAFNGLPERIAFATVPDRKAAQARWREADGGWRGSASSFARDYRWRSRDYAARLQAPWYRDVAGWLGVSASITAYPTVLTLLLNLLGAFFGWAARTIRVRRQKPA
ncbi:MAG: permease prefix domain 1-containing protein [Fimbriimonas sp.]